MQKRGINNMITLAICILIFIIGIIIFKIYRSKNKGFAISALIIGILSITLSISIFISEQLWVNSFEKYKQFYADQSRIGYLQEYRDRALEFNEQLQGKRHDKALFGEFVLISNKVFDYSKIPVYIYN
jgi:hypothetical protein